MFNGDSKDAIGECRYVERGEWNAKVLHDHHASSIPEYGYLDVPCRSDH